MVMPAKRFEGKSIKILWHLTPAGGPIVDEFFSTVPGWFFDMCTIQLEPKTHLPFRISLNIPLWILKQPENCHGFQ